MNYIYLNNNFEESVLLIQTNVKYFKNHTGSGSGLGSGSGIGSETLWKFWSGSGIGSEKNHSGSTTLHSKHGCENFGSISLLDSSVGLTDEMRQNFVVCPTLSWCPDFFYVNKQRYYEIPDGVLNVNNSTTVVNFKATLPGTWHYRNRLVLKKINHVTKQCCAPHNFHADPDPAVYENAGSDPASHSVLLLTGTVDTGTVVHTPTTFSERLPIENHSLLYATVPLRPKFHIPPHQTRTLKCQ